MKLGSGGVRHLVDSYHDYAAMPAVVRLDVEEVTMSTTDGAARTLPRRAPTKAGDWLRKVLLVCGPLSALVYIGWHEIAALQWEGYSRISNAISELHFTGTPSKSFLDPRQGWVDSALLAAFGIGIWLSAQGSRSLRVIGAVMIVPAAMITAVDDLRGGKHCCAPRPCWCGHLLLARGNGVRCRSPRKEVPDLFAGESRAGRGVLRAGLFVRTGGQRRATNTVLRALRAHRL